jgi:hypothetical protein
MTVQERRPLIDGLKAVEAEPKREVDPVLAKQFVYGPMGPTAPRPSVERTARPHDQPRRTGVSTRMREDFAKALKRASLERQMEGVHPQTLQDILEEAVEPWLRQHGYLP